LVGALGRLKDPPADGLAINESDPEAEPDHTLCGREAMLVVDDWSAGKGRQHTHRGGVPDLTESAQPRSGTMPA